MSTLLGIQRHTRRRASAPIPRHDGGSRRPLLAKWGSGLLLGMALLAAGPANALNLGDIIGVVGGGLAVNALAGPLDDFINTMTLNKGVKASGATAVVPIVSIGSGTHIGAAQVTGPTAAVRRTKAVAQVEVSFQGAIRVKILVPIDALNPVERFKRVQGVGVSAIIDVRL